MDKDTLNIIILILTALGTIASVVGLVYTFLRSFKIDIEKKFDAMDKHIDRIDENMKLQSKRTDHLYEICVELLRERK